MTEAILAGAVAGAIAGAITAAAVVLVMGRRAAGWRSYVSHGTAVGPRADMSSAQPWRHVTGVDHRASEGVPMASTLRLDDFDESGRRVMATAQEEAIRQNHNYIGTEHLLLGLIRGDAEGPAGRALAGLGVTLDKARTALEFIVGRGEAPVSPSEVTISPRSRKVLELARDEARHLGRRQVGAAEILLGLVREGEGIASGIIESLGVSLERVRAVLLSELGTGQRSPAPGTPPPSPPPGPARDVGHPMTGAHVEHAHRGPMGGPFDRFNDRAKRTLALAQDEAIRFNHNYLGTEHLLLGLIREGEGVAAGVLDGLGLQLSATRTAVERMIGRGEGTTPPSEITLSPRTKKVIELAVDEARKLGHSDVRTEHLLLGLVREGGGMACRIIEQSGVTLERVREQVIETLGRPD